ncbi:MAG TPA: hypothetical protein VL178_13960 [Pseudomonas sp.]|jgi:hypothetical protein|nr:hypothetical protein [Pseudomonas sp.]
MNTPYRREGDTWQIDLRLDRLQQLADTRDPSPFTRRDLDPDAERYIIDACRELPAQEPLALNLWLPAGELSAEIAERARHTVCFHFAWQTEHSQRRLREHLRMAHRTTLLGLSFMATCMLLVNLIGALDNLLAQTLAEGLMVIGWVALWRPVEMYLYDWWPLRRESRLLERLSRMPVSLHPLDDPRGSTIASADAQEWPAG